MKRVLNSVAAILIAAFMVIAFAPTSADADTYVRGYTRSDGTYVAPHSRSSPDSSHNNNWSVQGNRNPYTGSTGTGSRTLNDRTPDYNRQNFGAPLYDNNVRGSGGGGIYGR